MRVSAPRHGSGPLLVAGLLSLALHAAFASALLFWWNGWPDRDADMGPSAIAVELVQLAVGAGRAASAAHDDSDQPEPATPAAAEPLALAPPEPLPPALADEPTAAPTMEPKAEPSPKVERPARRKSRPAAPVQQAARQADAPTPPETAAPPPPQPDTAIAAPGDALPKRGVEGREPSGEASASAFGIDRAVSIVRNAPPTYPPAARRRGLEGRVVVRVQVSADGAPTDARVVASSGHELLDRRALDSVRTWRFAPALRDGRAIAEAIDVPIVFRLDSDRFARSN